MLIILLIIYSNYGFSDCGKIDNAKFNETILLDQHYQNLLQVHTVLEDVQRRIQNISKLKKANNENGRKNKEIDFDYESIRNLLRTKIPGNEEINEYEKAYERNSAKLHPFGQYNSPLRSDRGSTHIYPRFSPRLNYPQSLFIPRPASEYRMAIFPLNPGLGHPGFIFKPMRPRPNPPRLISNYVYQNVYLQPAPYLPNSPYRPPLKAYNQSSFDTQENAFIQKFPELPNFPRPSLYRPQLATSKSVTPSTPSTVRGTNIWLQGPYGIYIPVVNGWRNPIEKKQSTPLTHKRTLGLSTRHGSATTLSSTERIPKTKDYQAVKIHQKVTVAADADFKQEEHTPFFWDLLQTDRTAVPVPVPQYSKDLDSTTVGDVLDGKIKVQDTTPQPPTERYHDLMNRLDEGYMLVFMIELCRLIAVKDREDVRLALRHTETIYNHLWNSGRLAWVEEPLQTAVWKLALMTSTRDFDIVQTYASMMFHMLLRRREALSSEVNSLLDDAELLYNDEEGEQLFDALKEFENYPNSTKSSYWLCYSLIESFKRPFRRQHKSSRRQKLLEGINNALKARFPMLHKWHDGKHKKKRKRHRLINKPLRKRKSHNTPEYQNENRLTPEYHNENRLTPEYHNENRLTPEYHNENRLTPEYHNENRLTPEYHKENIFTPEYDNENIFQNQEHINYKNLIFRSMTSVTSHQAKFRVKPAKRFTIEKRPLTTINFLKRPSRIYSFNKRNKKLSHHIVTTPFEEMLNVFGNNDDDFKEKLNISSRNSDNFQEKLDDFNRNNDKSTKKVGHHHNHRKTSTARHRHSPKDVTTNGPMLLISNNSQPQLKRSRKDETHSDHMKAKLNKSEALKKDIGVLRAELLRKISAFPNLLRSVSSLL